MTGVDRCSPLGHAPDVPLHSPAGRTASATDAFEGEPASGAGLAHEPDQLLDRWVGIAILIGSVPGASTATGGNRGNGKLATATILGRLFQ